VGAALGSLHPVTGRTAWKGTKVSNFYVYFTFFNNSGNFCVHPRILLREWLPCRIFLLAMRISEVKCNRMLNSREENLKYIFLHYLRTHKNKENSFFMMGSIKCKFDYFLDFI
jgi:hypothetical protein